LRKKIYFTISTILALIIIILIWKYISNILNQEQYIDHILCEILPGATGKEIGETLYEHGVIQNKFLFTFLIRWHKIDTTLKAGHYLFTGSLSIKNVIDKIVSGEIIVMKVMLPEGISMYRVFRELSDNEVGNYDKYIELANNPDFIKDVTGLSISSLEGFLYPDTYIFSAGMSEESVIRTMVRNFYTRVYPPDIKMDNITQFYNDIILASIVEKEATHNDEKPMIASVYLNRINKKMKLQADPTVTYHLEPEFKHINRVTYSMLREQTPFNTYVITGLPPQPICNPTASSIFAVQNPETSKYLFFFSNRRGRHIFTETYQEHISRQAERSTL